ncbi:hypothetical protein [Staphylococcus epidermidis]|uniref:hypothetical protein n=1 Tax=Staphylococcus epidermidis TaxID=1282 RepID=UPI00050911DA|nr:hypothetical protein [Staphylococcus epidermidis]AIR83822.1 hypothetical protein DP17_1906 [Staphylococcus epidermidis]
MIKHIKITLGDFKDFQVKHDFDDANLLNMIAPVATMASKVKDMPSDCSPIAANSVLLSSYTLLIRKITNSFN